MSPFAAILLLSMATPDAPAPFQSSLTLRQAAGRNLDIGTCFSPNQFEDPSLSDILVKEFSVLEAENAMKFGPIHPRAGSDESAYDFAGADKLVAFALEHKMKVRGHTLIWHNQNARWVTAGNLTSEELREAMDGHIAKVMGRYAGKIYAWDVVNEAISDDGTLRHSPWFDRPGIGFAGQGTAYIERAFREARKADPKAKLFYNDYGAETLGAKADAIFAMMKDFKDRRVPLDGIGFQAHLIMEMNNPDALESIEKNFSRFAKLGLEIHITELDVRLRNGDPASLAAQAEFLGKFIAICRRQPRVKLIQTWGISDKHSWIPRAFRGYGWALLWDEDYRKKPAYDAVLTALRGK